MDLIRDILLAVETRTDPLNDRQVRIDGRSNYEVDYHVNLLVEAGLITGIAIASKDHPAGSHLVERLTWEGHEFLDAARADENWEKAKHLAKDKGGALTFETMKATLSALAREAVLIAIRASNS